MAAYAMSITDLDPLEHGLIFERFLIPDRVSMPDFDVDFAQKRLVELDAQYNQLATESIDRAGDYAGMVKKLERSKETTKKVLAELQVRQQQIFQAQVVLSGAAEENARLESMIRDLEIAVAKGARR